MKRWFDIWVSLLLVALLWPLMCCVGLLVRSKLGTPILFRQCRPGLNAAPFTMYKFRTLTDDRDTHGHLLPDKMRMTAFGSVLRQLSLDELPELFNVLKGDMSLVGPRPLLMQYIERYNPSQLRRHLVKPGITGWAQVNGRNALSWDKKFELDVWYVDHQSFGLDLKILLLTFVQVFKREGIHQDGHVTAEEFMGNADHGR
ncbi:MAG: sugar transferase [Desulfobacteraceae bacterium]|nr:MAG: sugar transferase [Desulfobacteraceae bacterium]